MKIDKSKLMKTAWEIARTAVKIFGGKILEYISESLKIAWRDMKKTSEKIYYVLKMTAFAADARDFNCIPDRWEITLTTSENDSGDSHEEYDDRFIITEIYEDKNDALDTISELQNEHKNVVLI